MDMNIKLLTAAVLALVVLAGCTTQMPRTPEEWYQHQQRQNFWQGIWATGAVLSNEPTPTPQPIWPQQTRCQKIGTELRCTTW